MFLAVGAALSAVMLAGGGSPAQESKSVQALLPDHTLVLMGTDSLQSTLNDLKSGALGKILAEEEVQDFLEKPLAMVKGLIEMGIAQGKAAAPEVDLDIGKLTSGPFGRTFVAVTHFELPSMEGEGPRQPDAGVVIGIEALQGAVDLIEFALQSGQTMLKAQMGAELPIETVKVGEQSYRKIVIPDPGAPALCFAKVDGISLFSPSEKAIKAILGVSQGQGASLAGAGRFSQAASSIGLLGPVIYADVSRIMSLVRGGVNMALAVSGDDKELKTLNRVFDVLELEKVGRVIGTASWKGGVAGTRFLWTPDSATSCVAKFASSSQKPVNKGLIGMVPQDASSFSLSHFDLAPIWDLIMAGFKEAAPDEYQMAMTQLNGMQAQVSGTDEQGNPNWDIRRDLIGAIGGEFGSISTPGAPTMFGPGTDSLYWLQTSNPQALDKSLQLLFALPGQFGMPLSFKESKHGDVTIKALDLSQMGPMAMAGAAMQPAYAMTGGRLYMGSSPTALKKFLELEANPPEKNIAEKPDFANGMKRLRSQGELTSISYGATATNFENYYSAILGLAPMLMMAGVEEDQLPFDISLLPSAEAVSQHLFGTVSATFKVQDGGVIMEMYGPFGIEMLVGILGVAGAGAAVADFQQSQAAAVMPDELVAVGSPMDAVQQDLRDLNAAVTVYSIEFGVPPAMLGEVVKPRDNYPNGMFVRGDKLPTDPWGNAYNYSVDGEDYLLWSSGPNGTSENGDGDDVRFR